MRSDAARVTLVDYPLDSVAGRTSKLEIRLGRQLITGRRAVAVLMPERWYSMSEAVRLAFAPNFRLLGVMALLDVHYPAERFEIVEPTHHAMCTMWGQ